MPSIEIPEDNKRFVLLPEGETCEVKDGQIVVRSLEDCDKAAKYLDLDLQVYISCMIRFFTLKKKQNLKV